jgi:hypothetical protein
MASYSDQNPVANPTEFIIAVIEKSHAFVTCRFWHPQANPALGAGSGEEMPPRPKQCRAGKGGLHA